MTTASTSLGVRTKAGWEHTSGKTHKLIFRAQTIDPPPALRCGKLKCLLGYLVRLIVYFFAVPFIILYHKERHIYVYKHRDDNIPMKYRTGKPSPSGIFDSLIEIIKIKIRR